MSRTKWVEAAQRAVAGERDGILCPVNGDADLLVEWIPLCVFQRMEMRVSEITTVVLTGWNEGFNKVQFNQFLRDRCDLGLADAKAVVDKVLQHERVDLEFRRLSRVDIQRMTEFGVKFEQGAKGV